LSAEQLFEEVLTDVDVVSPEYNLRHEGEEAKWSVSE
jgi:hypothetical protein